MTPNDPARSEQATQPDIDPMLRLEAKIDGLVQLITNLTDALHGTRADLYKTREQMGHIATRLIATHVVTKSHEERIAALEAEDGNAGSS